MNIRFIYKPLRLALLFVMLGILFNCKSNKLDRDNADARDLKVLESLLEMENYYVAINAAFPFNTAATQQVLNSSLFRNTGNNANRIEMSGDGNFIRIQKDSATSYLPFFGERRLNAGRYGGADSAIQFDGLENYEMVLNSEKKKLVMKFSTDQKGDDTDSYDVILEIFPNNNVDVHINGAFRTFMRYTGKLKPIPESLAN